jgi:CelD/BcsL family acetyltransferase involved in cellulose biosynthesis
MPYDTNPLASPGQAEPDAPAPNPLASLSEAERDDLARRALDMREKSKKRSKKQRELKRAAGLVPITAYVPADRADYVRQVIKTILDMSDEEFHRRQATKRS